MERASVVNTAICDLDRAEVLRDAGLTAEAESAPRARRARLRCAPDAQARGEAEFHLARSLLAHDPARAARTRGSRGPTVPQCRQPTLGRPGRRRAHPRRADGRRLRPRTDAPPRDPSGHAGPRGDRSGVGSAARDGGCDADADGCRPRGRAARGRTDGSLAASIGSPAAGTHGRATARAPSAFARARSRRGRESRGPTARGSRARGARAVAALVRQPRPADLRRGCTGSRFSWTASSSAMRSRKAGRPVRVVGARPALQSAGRAAAAAARSGGGRRSRRAARSARRGVIGDWLATPACRRAARSRRGGVSGARRRQRLSSRVVAHGRVAGLRSTTTPRFSRSYWSEGRIVCLVVTAARRAD